MTVCRRLEFSQLAHVNPVAIADSQKLPQLVLSRFAFEIHHQSSLAFSNISIDARYSSEPLKLCAFIILVIKSDIRIHVSQREKLFGLISEILLHTRLFKMSLIKSGSPRA